MNREPAERELAGAAAGHPAEAALRPTGGSEIDHLRMQRLQSVMLLCERRQLAMLVYFGLERLSRDLGRAFAHSAGLRFMAIRQRHRASVARLASPARLMSVE